MTTASQTDSAAPERCAALTGSALVIADVVDTVPLTMLGNLPCPFCGSTNLSRLRPKKEGMAAWIMCESCGATGPNQSVDAAEAWWNKRAYGPEIFIRPTDAERIIALNS